MKTALTFITILLIGTSAFAELETDRYFECTLPQAEEYRVSVDLEMQQASFFDNDSTSFMAYTHERASTSKIIPESRVLIFVGKDNGGSGDLQLEFNSVSKRIRLSTVETDGTIELLGYASCVSRTTSP